jgi:tripartite-type tricarboxylate transporter receptor subunit TctC
MVPGRLVFGVVLASVLLAAVGLRPAAAQQYPTRPITMIVGFAPGGFIDVLARVVAQKLSERLGQPVVVENRAGAGGNIAHRIVATAPADGYTLLAATTSLAINETLYKNRGYAAHDFVPINIAVSTPEVLANHPDRREGTLQDLVRTAKDTPINFGTAGAGSGSYIASEYFFRVLAKVPAVHVPYQGGAPVINAGMGNQIDVVAVAMAGGVVGPIRNGKLRGLAVASEQRVSLLPNVPTYSEAGYAGFTASAWGGFFAPAKTDPEVVGKLNFLIDEIMKEPDVLARLRPIGFEPIHGSVTQMDKLFEAELEKWGKMVSSIGVSIQ